MMDVEWAEPSYFPLETAFRHTLAFIHRDTKKDHDKLREQVAFLNTLTQSRWVYWFKHKVIPQHETRPHPTAAN